MRKEVLFMTWSLLMLTLTSSTASAIQVKCPDILSDIHPRYSRALWILMLILEERRTITRRPMLTIFSWQFSESSSSSCNAASLSWRPERWGRRTPSTSSSRTGWTPVWGPSSTGPLASASPGETGGTSSAGPPTSSGSESPTTTSPSSSSSLLLRPQPPPW